MANSHCTFISSLCNSYSSLQRTLQPLPFARVLAQLGVCVNDHTNFLENGGPDVIAYMPFRPDFLPIVFFKDI